ncbi:helix-turn-helix transcriptional regulator [Solwaraspora sp. WMMD406]|uniref:helix-turn-helix domain-containing protein n=1 Tax=Solwaraspora sp. WMMD406 TaxID=3016095 RepID=UPI00241649DC|nr:helix-turn-helix transcriptional regulator [Solwaraspora sp. WMMD406]MDG4764344.1 helix-turn-helix transcriptional regulator [Solwaraspora sp. WMMD406]
MADTNDFRHVLRRERMARGISQDALGAEVYVTGSQIGNYEAGRSIPPDGVARALDEKLGAEGELLKLVAVARGEAVAPWLRPWKTTERQAILLRWYEHSIIPGLLQTEAYARMVVEAGPNTEAQVDGMTHERLERQAATLGRSSPVTLSAIVGEAALRLGDPTIMKEQLEHLVEIGDRPNVHVRVVPFAAGMHAGLGGAFVLASMPDGSSVAYVDGTLEGEVVSKARDLGRLLTAWESICTKALPCDQSRAFILKVVDEL